MILLFKSFIISNFVRLLPFLGFIKSNWKLCLFLTSIAGNVYLYTRLDSVKHERATKNVIIEEKENKIWELQLHVQNQNVLVDQLNKNLTKLEKVKEKSSEEIKKLNTDLKESLNKITHEKIGDDCSDKLDYLRDGVNDLKW